MAKSDQTLSSSTKVENARKQLNESASFAENLSNRDEARTNIFGAINSAEVFYQEFQQAQQRVRWLEQQLNLKASGSDKHSDSSGGNNDTDKDASDHSSERERNKDKDPAANTGRKPKDKLTIHQTEHIKLDLSGLPEDLQKLPDRSSIYQDIVFDLRNVHITREAYYSPSTDQIYLAALPQGYGENEDFGPGIKSLILSLKYDQKMSESSILSFLKNMGVEISAGTISNIALREGVFFELELEQIMLSALSGFSGHQFDDTGCRVSGEAWHTHIINNEYYAIYCSRPNKDRLTFLDVLLGRESHQRIYRFEESTWELLEHMGISAIQHGRLQSEVELAKNYSQQQFDELLERLFPDPNTYLRMREIITDAAAITYYQYQEEVPKITSMMTDCAPQFGLIFLYHALCWIHEGRRYKKLSPVSDVFGKELEAFLEKFWQYYHDLNLYRQSPSQEQAEELRARFDEIFRADTKYDALNDLINRSAARKEQLLLVLDHPELPLHNNRSELAARAKARNRDINLHNASQQGARVTDVMMSIVETCKRLGVNATEYIRDRVSRKCETPSLAQLIGQRSQQDPFGYGVMASGP